MSLGLLPGEAFEPVTHPSFVTSSLRGIATDGVFDSSDRAEGENLIFWWNERRKDGRYARWQPSLYALLHPTYPGQAPSVRRNMFNVVFVFDLSRPASLHFITNTVSMFIDRSYPIRLGVVPINYGHGATIRFFSAVREPQILDLQDRGEPELYWSHVQAQFEALAGSEEIKGEERHCHSIFWPAALPKSSKRGSTRLARMPNGWEQMPNGHIFINGTYCAPDNVYAGAITDNQADDIVNNFKDGLDRAKTIALCQKPLTNRRSRARQIPKWEQYDTEIARFTRRLMNEGRIHASAAAADVNKLAEAGAIPVPVLAEETMQSRVTGEEDSGGKCPLDPWGCAAVVTYGSSEYGIY
ncbi:hypothetical protein EDB86DRAFT_3147569 [Lactarius hatsudake]|nr:hypothetical protein EDB86DRAFT_3147569 [Lactarius hatsudake]